MSPSYQGSPHVLRFQAIERYALSGGREGYERLRVLAAARRANTLELSGWPVCGPACDAQTWDAAVVM